MARKHWLQLQWMVEAEKKKKKPMWQKIAFLSGFLNEFITYWSSLFPFPVIWLFLVPIRHCTVSYWWSGRFCGVYCAQSKKSLLTKKKWKMKGEIVQEWEHFFSSFFDCNIYISLILINPFLLHKLADPQQNDHVALGGEQCVSHLPPCTSRFC